MLNLKYVFTDTILRTTGINFLHFLQPKYFLKSDRYVKDEAFQQ